MFGLSQEQSSFQRSNRCPLCRAFPIIPTYAKPDGTALSGLTFLPLMDRSAVAKCPKCKGQWPVFADAQLPGNEPPPPPEVQIVETDRTTEDYYVEPMELDNLGGTTALTREVTINEKWTESYVVETDRARTLGGEFDLGLGKIASLKLTAETVLTRKYSATQGAERTYTDKITIEVPPRTRRIVSFIYKLVWQHGLIIVPANGSQVEIPFKAAIDLNLDLAQHDSNASV